METDTHPRIAAFADRFLTALLAADRPRAEETVDDALGAGLQAITLLDELIAPVMHEVGRLWEAGAIGVADEHLSTVIAHGTLTRIYPKLVAAEPRTRGRVLLAGADGEQHVLGLRIVADVLEANGFEVRNTGASLPPDSLAAAVVRHQPVLVGLGCTVVADQPTLMASVNAVRAVAQQLPILLGGAAAGTAELDDRMQVCRSAREALAAADRMLGQLS
jgi:MerR family transcriptional regulator, light-induced transcriptional regulator